ncbi:MAG: helix-turn-helix domain-containing protein [Pseudonocardiaceae bacterium]
MTNKPEIPYTAREVAALLGVAPRTVHRWTSTGQLPLGFRTLGGQLRFHAGDIWALIDDEPSPHRGPDVSTSGST